MDHVGVGARRRRRALAVGVATVAIGAVLGSSQGEARDGAERALEPFDSNGKDDSFRIALSREQGPLITGSPGTTLTASGANSGDPERGTFAAQVAWPIMPIHAVLLPDGRVLTYGTDRNGAQTAHYDFDVWDPSAGYGRDAHTTLPNASQTDIFCSAQVVLADGVVEVYGGDHSPTDTNTFNRDVNQFDPADDTVSRTGTMQRDRWYATATNLPDASVLVQGGLGGHDFPEVRRPDGSFHLLTGAPTGGLSSGYPKNFVGPDGRVFGLAHDIMYRLDTSGDGAITRLGRFPSDNVGGASTSVMFAPGRILQVGGGDAHSASRRASIIDINGSTPQVRAAPAMRYGRLWGTATVMADGRVLVSGGSAVNNAAEGVAYTAEIFDPATRSWTSAARAQRMRLYHSTSLLLPDATVITMGGGAPGPETNLNAEVYHPPYLFASDGSRRRRPTISRAPAVADPGTALRIETPDAGSISRVTLVKLGSVTHSFDMDQRFLTLPFTAAGSTLTATLPVNRFETPPGYYMIFILDERGVPSQAKIVRINVAVNLVANGGFEANAVTDGRAQHVASVAGWWNRGNPMEVWSNVARRPAGEGSAFIELDASGRGNRAEQTVATVRGRRYALSFLQSPRPGVETRSNRFAVYWNDTRLGVVARNGAGLATTSWRRTTFTVTGTGSDRISFRERDRNGKGALIDAVHLMAV